MAKIAPDKFVLGGGGGGLRSSSEKCTSVPTPLTTGKVYLSKSHDVIMISSWKGEALTGNQLKNSVFMSVNIGLVYTKHG